MSHTTPQRQVVVFLSIVYVLTLAIALLVAPRGMAPLLVIPIPALATCLVIVFVVPAAQRRRAWSQLGLGRLGLRQMSAAIGLPALIAAGSFAAAAALGVASLSTAGLGLGGTFALNFVITFVLNSVLFLGEEIGWRGFLLPRVAEIMPFGRAAMLVGVAQWIFHLPLYLTPSGYMSAGSRWVTVPVALVTFAAGGVFYAWLRGTSGSVWPAAVGHNAFNTWFETLTLMATVSSPAALAYVAGETGVATMLLALLGAWVLLRRSPLFRRDAQPSMAPGASAELSPRNHTQVEEGRSGDAR